jgi:L-aspartate oxidase
MRVLETDVVVVGSGIAGLTFALRAAEGVDVVLVTKKERAASNTNHARGGIAVVLGEDDALELHVGDTLVAGAGLCHHEVVELVVREGPARVRDLMAWGAEFERRGERLSLGREGGHSRRRIVHAGDRTGRAIETALLDAAEEQRLRIVEDHMAVDLLVEDTADGAPRVAGVEVLDEATGERLHIRAFLVLLATGGCGRIYRHTTNPAIATGDGVAMAYRAGAAVANMEFIQFHPTALYPTEDPAFLVSEAVRGEGAVLRRLDGTPFMDRHHPLGSLAPRDVVARAIHRELTGTGDPHVVLDVSPLAPGVLAARFPAALEGCRARGIEPDQDGIPVVPAAHYACGGVWTDTSGRTSLPGLLAAGEVACTGLHGANRLASNSLLEAVVVAHRAARAARTDLEAAGRWGAPSRSAPVDRGAARPGSLGAEGPLLGAAEAARDRMWLGAGIVRSGAGLAATHTWLTDALAAQPTVDAVATPAAVEARNVLEISELVVRSALGRPESRGLHFLEDHPWRDNEVGLVDTVLVRTRET